MAISYQASDSEEMLRHDSPPEEGFFTDSFIYYLDVNADWTGDYDDLVVKDENAIFQRIINLIAIVPGEELFEPTLGSGVQFDLFEPAHDGGPTDRTAMSIETHTLHAASIWMRREIRIDHSRQFVSVLPEGDGYFINMPFWMNTDRDVKRLRHRLVPHS